MKASVLEAIVQYSRIHGTGRSILPQPYRDVSNTLFAEWLRDSLRKGVEDKEIFEDGREGDKKCELYVVGVMEIEQSDWYKKING
jgi:hypothetical protein